LKGSFKSMTMLNYRVYEPATIHKPLTHYSCWRSGYWLLYKTSTHL